MPSDQSSAHCVLADRLVSLTGEVERALHEEDYEALDSLLARHASLMERWRKADERGTVHSEHHLRSASTAVNRVIAEIERLLEEKSFELAALRRRRIQVEAYTRPELQGAMRQG